MIITRRFRHKFIITISVPERKQKRTQNYQYSLIINGCMATRYTTNGQNYRAEQYPCRTHQLIEIMWKKESIPFPHGRGREREITNEN